MKNVQCHKLCVNPTVHNCIFLKCEMDMMQNNISMLKSEYGSLALTSLYIYFYVCM